MLIVINSNRTTIFAVLPLLVDTFDPAERHTIRHLHIHHGKIVRKNHVTILRHIAGNLPPQTVHLTEDQTIVFRGWFPIWHVLDKRLIFTHMLDAIHLPVDNSYNSSTSSQPIRCVHRLKEFSALPRRKKSAIAAPLRIRR